MTPEDPAGGMVFRVICHCLNTKDKEFGEIVIKFTGIFTYGIQTVLAKLRQACKGHPNNRGLSKPLTGK